jgi:hypothetical protein
MFPIPSLQAHRLRCVNPPIAGKKGMRLGKLRPAAKPTQNFVFLEKRG